MLLSYKYINSPVGQLKLVANENALVAVLWDNENPKRVRLAELVEQTEHPILLKTEQQLAEYFEGKRREFTLPLDFEGTPFQKQVWAALLTIPYGETRSYKDIAVQIGNEKQCEQWVLQMAKIRFQLLHLVTESLVRAALWLVLPVVLIRKIFY